MEHVSRLEETNHPTDNGGWSPRFLIEWVCWRPEGLLALSSRLLLSWILFKWLFNIILLTGSRLPKNLSDVSSCTFTSSSISFQGWRKIVFKKKFEITRCFHKSSIYSAVKVVSLDIYLTMHQFLHIHFSFLLPISPLWWGLKRDFLHETGVTSGMSLMDNEQPIEQRTTLENGRKLTSVFKIVWYERQKLLLRVGNKKGIRDGIRNMHHSLFWTAKPVEDGLLDW